MDVSAIYNQLSNKPDKIIQILEALNFTNIHYNHYKNNLRFAREQNRNPSSCLIDCNTLRFFVFSTNQSGNIFTLIMDKMNCSFYQSLRFAAIKAGIKDDIVNIKVNYPFGGFYKKLIPSNKCEDILTTYPESVLKEYSGKYSKMFFKDGIDYITQEHFGIGYDFETDRITIPERSISGELIGIMGRSNDPNCEHSKRWIPIIPCSRNHTLYGYSQNYKRICESKTIVIYESEKAVMQSRSFGCGIALATCGCNISLIQKKYIQLLQPSKIIIAYDEGLEEEKIRNEAKKLIENNHILKTDVGYVWDSGEIIPTGSKKNLADLGKDAYIYGMSRMIKWIK